MCLMPRLHGAAAVWFLVVFAVAGCVPGGEAAPSSPEFVIPDDGAILTQPTRLAATGAPLDVVRFEVDDVVLHEDTAPPFEWTVDPAAIDVGEHTLSIAAYHGDDMHSVSVTVTIAPPVGGTPPATGPAPTGDVATDIANLGAKQWYEIPGTRLDAVQPDPVPYPGHVHGVIAAWSSGVYDTKRDQLVVWGGGHGDYAGNEVYAFSMKTFQWSRLTDPSSFGSDPNNTANAPRHADGRPVSRHTYDYLEYIPPPVDRMICAGGSALWKVSFIEDATYYFDFDRLEWETLSDICPTADIGNTTALGPDGRVWSHGMNGAKGLLAVFDPATRKWTKHVFNGGWMSYDKTAEIDPVENKYVLIGQGTVRVWDLNNPDQPHVSPTTTGATQGQNLSHPGAAWDPNSREILVWHGGATVYSFNVRTSHWTAHATSGMNTTPPAATAEGTNGRWRYVPSLNVFVLVDSTSGNVFVYRHTAQ